MWLKINWFWYCCVWPWLKNSAIYLGIANCAEVFKVLAAITAIIIGVKACGKVEDVLDAERKRLGIEQQRLEIEKLRIEYAPRVQLHIIGEKDRAQLAWINQSKVAFKNPKLTFTVVRINENLEPRTLGLVQSHQDSFQPNQLESFGRSIELPSHPETNLFLFAIAVLEGSHDFGGTYNTNFIAVSLYDVDLKNKDTGWVSESYPEFPQVTGKTRDRLKKEVQRLIEMNHLQP